ncbi:MAG TPA: tRNA preQ1(34) S-adenosylmethionine ribosyltransferase-isomerase QueA [Candidatus Omnitrophica bacterium]|nr:MAG: tRNA preQ1(34) S-adenosylmethionine ribosyltransferase-isomerase QueA [Omnitrophica WOR_2 bacterium GWA2_45_18]OGX20117.1 MAG: tRNA preQ1(34) S-adenosylmethionine ribosyltransferase-isomerase QueA [Omnitrophica WOR_2 bacterium GWC2_45_7]HBR15209.1 tRNA preQ1(34) S-adenosylmethionine ribosyltransferase-isomerase QueA [Candidatus Omnitrophota bacterium]
MEHTQNLTEETHLKEFGYDLPQALIAQFPLTRRDKARLMVVDRKTGSFRHDSFSNIGRYLPEESLIVLNDSKVIPARLLGRRDQTGGEVEFFLLKALGDGDVYEVLMRPMRRLKEHEQIAFADGQLVAQIIDKENRLVRFNKRDVLKYLHKAGHMPLPPYIDRPDKAIDRKYYQTVYARKWGSVACPTAGLHFTTALLERLKKKGHKLEKVTLHVNYGTFKPVEEQDIRNHKMHEEQYMISSRAFSHIIKARENGKKIVVVGTTSCRVLETVAQTGHLKGQSNIFIYPGYPFRLVDVLLTNFHFPYSTLLMLVYAFGTKALMRKAYQEAIERKYMFYSYGDAMLIL